MNIIGLLIVVMITSAEHISSMLILKQYVQQY